MRHGIGKIVRFDGAAVGEGGRIKIKDHRTILESVGEREAEILSAERGLGCEIRRLGAFLQSRNCRHNQARGKDYSKDSRPLHVISPVRPKPQ